MIEFSLMQPAEFNPDGPEKISLSELVRRVSLARLSPSESLNNNERQAES